MMSPDWPQLNLFTRDPLQQHHLTHSCTLTSTQPRQPSILLPNHGAMEKNNASPQVVRTVSAVIPANLGRDPRSECRLIKRAAVIILAVTCFIIFFTSVSLPRFLDDTMVKWKVWSMAVLPTVAASGMHVLDLSTANWTVGNGANITVPGTLPSVVRLIAKAHLHIAWLRPRLGTS